MAKATRALADDAARRTAITVHDRSFLVEAGAGSGKTAVMAGRIAMLLAAGVAPRAIAAVTFTELAASELLIRVREFVDELTVGRVPAELRVALPKGLSNDQRRRLAAASALIDEITCSTIHGFCQRLITPYPVEANIDPGATVMDPGQADLAFGEALDGWLREELAGETGGLIAEMVLQKPDETLALIRKILGHIRRRRAVTIDAPARLAPVASAFRKAAASFTAFLRKTGVDEPESAEIAARFAEMAEQVAAFGIAGSPCDLVRLLMMEPGPALCIRSGEFRKYQKKGKWGAAARQIGLPAADADRFHAMAQARHLACCETWTTLRQAVAARVLADVVATVRPVLDRFQHYKRSAALIDFDDLIFAARDLLRRHEDVRAALATRYAHLLVDEFQDTDPLQTEIFWRLCGEPPAGIDASDWTNFRIRPGALFVVGDPKQAIYRFRGADVAAYIAAREALLRQDPNCILSISTNFRSCAPILHYVNERFAPVLAVERGQPGFTALDAFHPGREGLCVAALDIEVADEHGKASSEQRRDGEAEAVADMCARLIGNEGIIDRKAGGRRPCRAGDIALLAPTGTELWRYEEALEQRGIPVATQAGKGLFRRQEIQDLIALTRVLADQRDTLALGALLRGPLVGLTEEELLDVAWELPRYGEAPEALPRLALGVEPENIRHPLARDVIEKLQALRRRIHASTPYDLLSQAVDVLRLRPILLQRHGGQAERALANVDLYLSLSRPYAVRGLRAFAEAMTAAWEGRAAAVEGRPDAQEEAVTLYTMHAAKGLEWPIVVPINTATQGFSPDAAVTDRTTGIFYSPVFGVKPTGYQAAWDAEKAELDRERIRLWYVAATRAREILVLPRLDVAVGSSAWISLLDLSLSDLPAIDVTHLPAERGTTSQRAENRQTRELFATEAAAIADRQRHIVWLAPSRDESTAEPVLRAELPQILVVDPAGAQPVDITRPRSIQGSRERGLILHKLLEEVLTGETAESTPSLIERADALIRMMGLQPAKDPREGPCPRELAASVTRGLSLPEIAALRPNLVPELPVFGATWTEAAEQVIAGIADAIAYGPDNKPQVVIDWKSDVDPTPATIDHYRAQVRAYLELTDAERGLIVMVTPGRAVPVELGTARTS
jgi:exodeoxyribonuclease-5